MKLIDKFPDAPFVARTKIWSPLRNSLEVDGPYNDIAGELLMRVAVCSHPTGRKLEAMRKCLEILKEDDPE